jgi:hypothetical protein
MCLPSSLLLVRQVRQEEGTLYVVSGFLPFISRSRTFYAHTLRFAYTTPRCSLLVHGRLRRFRRRTSAALLLPLPACARPAGLPTLLGAVAADEPACIPSEEGRFLPRYRYAQPRAFAFSRLKRLRVCMRGGGIMLRTVFLFLTACWFVLFLPDGVLHSFR